ncbi:MAG TPA: phosphoglycerate kinase [Alphaproteobacteria bacterium]|nr:phosphoglycerate kinase [Alphaproteobacteria bacterium]
MPAFLTLDDLDVRGKRVLVRADLNVPMKDGKVSDATRLERLAPTIDELARKGARVILLSHFGRPEGKPVPRYSLEPLVPALARTLGGRKVAFAHDCVGPEAKAAAARLGDGEVALLENLRFEPGEEANDPAFARALASLGELYVDDAFSCAHRAHASVAALAQLLPAAAGRLMEAELGYLAQALEAPARPLAALVGGAKVSTKLELLGNLVAKVDLLIIGGGMANTFLAAQGIEVGRSLAERDLAATASAILARAAARNCTILLPTDAVVAAGLEAGAASRTVAIGSVPAEAMILDIGPETAAALAARIAQCRTLVWNGPLGAFETPPFDAGTNAVARAAAALTKAGKLVSIAGGGDTVAALHHAGVAEDFSYVSTAGGAFLEWLEGRELPGVAALEAAAKA